MSIDNFHLVRTIRKDTNKQHGGVAAYVNEKWCKQVSIKKKLCNSYNEYLVFSCRPFYLLREFNNVYFTVVYIPPSNDYSQATELLANCINECPQGIKIVLGEFNGCAYHQIHT